MATVTQGAGGKQTIVIAAPKSGVAGATPTKIITTIPKLSTSTTSGTQFIVVTTRAGAHASDLASHTSGGKQIITIVTAASALQGALAGVSRGTLNVSSSMAATTAVTSSLSSAVSSAPVVVMTRNVTPSTAEAAPSAENMETGELTEAALAAEALPMQVDGVADEYYVPQLDGAGDEENHTEGGADEQTEGENASAETTQQQGMAFCCFCFVNGSRFHVNMVSIFLIYMNCMACH